MNKNMGTRVGTAIVATALVGMMIAPEVAAVPWSGTVKVTWDANNYEASPGGEFSLIPTAAVSDEAAQLAANNAFPYWDGYVLNNQIGTQIMVGKLRAFESFCLEYNEYLEQGRLYSATVGLGAIGGGRGGAVNGQDLISSGTAWLYSQFARGTLADYIYTPLGDGPNIGGYDGRKDSAKQLQQAIWFLEDEISLSNTGSNLFLKQVLSQFGDLTTAKADSKPYEFGVAVLNLKADVAGQTYTQNYSNGGNAQSQLIYVPDGGTTLLLLGMGMGGLAMVSRRKLS
ncbi:MAG: VPDSG-CTERM sorting domain-containing protein [Limisphaerales bacterium]